MRYRFRRGTTEIEMEFTGDVPNEQMKVVSDLLEEFSSFFRSQVPAEETENPTTSQPMSSGRKSRRGGKRTAFVSPALDKLIESKWLLSKTTDEVVKKLRTSVPAANEGNVTAALLRKLGTKIARIERDDGATLWTVHTTGED